MLSLSWLLTSAATAATWTVPTDFSTIGAAASAAAAGDVIVIEPGTYVDRVRVTKDLTFLGEPGSVWVSTFGEFEALEVENATVTVQGIQFGARNRSRAIDLLGGATVLVEDCVFADGESELGGGIRARFGTSLIVHGSTFLSNHARVEGGGILAEDLTLLEVEDSTFLGGSAPAGGGVGMRELPDAQLTRLWLEDNGADEDGGALSANNSTVVISESMLCANHADDDGAGADVRGTSVFFSLGSIWMNGAAVNEGGAIDADTSSTLLTINNHFVGNQGTGSGAAFRGAIHTSINDLIAYNGTGTTVHNIPAASLSYVGFWANDAGDTTAPAPIVTSTTDPLLATWPAPTCTANVRPAENSPLIDNGDFAIYEADGTRSDIGAFGGTNPFAAVPPRDGDLDGDGAEAGFDCDDTDPTSHPGAVEICDGRDNDCDGNVPNTEADADADGYLSCGDDCNDGDDDVHPGATELAGDGVDQDCDGDELCYDDPDNDGFGSTTQILSDDLDCNDVGEANNPDDVCPYGDDNDDRDADGTPDACDACPDDPLDDSDGDGVCDGVDVCHGYNDNDDADGDGIPNGCDDCQSLLDADYDGTPDDCDLCPGYDDNDDNDADGTADGCDACPLDNPNDTDGDSVCDSDDICEGDDTVDSDSDGIPDDCDPTPLGEPGTTGPTEPTDTGTTPPTTDPGPVDTGVIADGDEDGDGVPNRIDPDPTHAGDDGRGVAPEPRFGCGCSQSTPLSTTSAVLALAFLLRRRRN